MADMQINKIQNHEVEEQNVYLQSVMHTTQRELVEQKRLTKKLQEEYAKLDAEKKHLEKM